MTGEKQVEGALETSFLRRVAGQGSLNAVLVEWLNSLKSVTLKAYVFLERWLRRRDPKNAELEFEIVRGGLLIKPVKVPRRVRTEVVEAALERGEVT